MRSRRARCRPLRGLAATFYELFTDREDCFLAVFDIAVARAAESVLPAL